MPHSAMVHGLWLSSGASHRGIGAADGRLCPRRPDAHLHHEPLVSWLPLVAACNLMAVRLNILQRQVSCCLAVGPCWLSDLGAHQSIFPGVLPEERTG